MKRRLCLRVLGVAIAASLSTGCGLIFNGTRQQVMVDTAPAGGTVEVDGVRHQTPVTLDLRRKDVHTVVATNARGATVTRNIIPEGDTLFVLMDLGTCPVLCNLVDSAFGGDRTLVPSPLLMPLPPENAGPEFRSGP
ncbi:MAG: hypothetical protein ACHQ4J_08115 [Candidatus Binatia bacterium]